MSPLSETSKTSDPKKKLQGPLPSGFQLHNGDRSTAAVGFLGFGLHYPTFDWGDMLNNGITYLQDGYWWQIYPVGICIIVVVMACNLLGDALRDALDVRLRRR